MIGWLKKTWGLETNNKTPDFLPTEYSQGAYGEQSTSGDRHTSTRTLDDIIVEGSGRFVNHANHCIEEVRGTKWESLVSELRKITQCSSYADSGVINGVYEVGPDGMGLGAWGDDRILGASVLIHEAVHTKRQFNGEFDWTNFAGEELIAFAEQSKFLRLHGHPDAADIENSDGRHNELYLSPELLALQR